MRAALAVSGEYRALDVMHSRFVSASSGLDAECVAFLWLEMARPTSCCPGGHHCVRPRSETLKDGQRWPSISDALVNRTVKRYQPAFIHYDPGSDAESGLCYNALPRPLMPRVAPQQERTRVRR